MYSPSLFSNNLFTLWNQEHSIKSIASSDKYGPHQMTHNGSSIHHNHHPANSQLTSRQPTAEQLLMEERKQSRLLFAPPLQAYSAEFPGANSAELEFTIQSTNLITGYRHGKKFITTTPLIQSKIDQLERIRTTGYSNIRPIGISKTLEEIDYDNANQYSQTGDDQFDDQSYLNAAENSHDNHGNNVNNSTNNNQSSIGGGSTANITISNTTTGGVSINNIGRQLLEQSQDDLDANIVDVQSEDDDDEADLDGFDESVEEYDDLLHLREHEHQRRHERSQDTSRINSGNHNQMYANTTFRSIRRQEDEGFMADEVEYQDDHSLNAEYVINSGSTAYSTLNNSGRSLTTNSTTLPSSIGPLQQLHSLSRIREFDEDDDDPNENENENDEDDEDGSNLDMIVEGN